VSSQGIIFWVPSSQKQGKKVAREARVCQVGLELDLHFVFSLELAINNTAFDDEAVINPSGGVQVWTSYKLVLPLPLPCKDTEHLCTFSCAQSYVHSIFFWDASAQFFVCLQLDCLCFY
jgi:hypothetical protein